ncbi:restriction endonuclease [Myxococcota bacterium]|nr:restriction endonuclease [Myxococcota bacterium]
MAESNNVWGIHAGRGGEAEQLFLEQKVIALGWAKVVDLSTLKPEREVFKAKIAELYPDKKAGAIPNAAGQLFRFVHEVKVGDLVLYSSKTTRQIHLGIIEGAYTYEPSAIDAYPHRRRVKWLRAVSRTKFTQGALYELGSALSFFQVKTYADEYRAATKGQVPTTVPEESSETLRYHAEEIEATTRDFILKQLAKELKGHPFQEFVEEILQLMGYRTRGSPEGTDGGIDIIAHKDELGFEPPIVKVQVKSTEGSVGDPVVSALYGKVGPNEFGLLVTLGTYTNQARAFGRSKTNLRLIDGTELVELVLRHYDRLDSRYKGLLPLRRLYVPEPLEDTDD